MSLRIDSIITSIKTAFNTVNDFRTALTGGLYFGQIKQETSYPYGTYRIIDSVPDSLIDGSRMEEYRIRFNLFSKSTSLTEISTLARYCEDLYDNGLGSISNYEYYDFEFDFFQADIGIEEGVHEWALDFILTARNVTP
jgi:hypothetical protein